MKYRDLRLSFSISNIKFTILSIGDETFDYPIPRHNHSMQSYELHYVKSGHGTLKVDSTSYKLSSGDFYVTGPEVFHEQISDTLDPVREYGMYLRTDYEGKLSMSNPMLSFTNVSFWLGEGDKVIPVLFEKIFSELSKKPYLYELMLPPLIEELLLTVTRMYSALDSKSVKDDPLENKPEDLISLTIEEAFLYGYQNITLESLAAQINLGTRQTERLLKKHYNTTFSRMKLEARMSAASVLLLDTQKSISEISEELGFSSSEHFTNAFKKFYNVTPLAYRKGSK